MVTIQLPLAGMLAFVNVTPELVVIKLISPPVQVVWAATLPVAVAMLRLLGKIAEKLDWVSAKPLELLRVMVRVESTFSPTVAGEKLSAIVGAAGVTVRAAGHAVVPALAGVVEAAVTAPPAPTDSVAVSTAPALSVTVKVTVPLPLAVIVALAAAAPEEITTEGPEVLHA